MTTPLKTLRDAVKFLEKANCMYCIIGGHAASLYRTQERFTKDVDFALIANPLKASRKLAEGIIKSIGLKPVIGFIPPGPKEPKRKSICMITSKPLKGELKGIIDILLPELPWVEEAVRRAQHNKIDLGFLKVPVITPEDLVIAKCYALRNSPDRFQDLDDIKQIFISVKDLDFDYIDEKLIHHSLIIPNQIKKFTPK